MKYKFPEFLCKSTSRDSGENDTEKDAMYAKSDDDEYKMETYFDLFCLFKVSVSISNGWDKVHLSFNYGHSKKYGIDLKIYKVNDQT